MLRIEALGGYGEIGRNMTILSFDGMKIALDCGMHIDRLLETNCNVDCFSQQELEYLGIIPPISKISNLQAALATHAHLDHIGAMRFLNCDIFVPCYTSLFLKRNMKVNSAPINKKISISDDIEVEFIPIAHSTPQTRVIAVHTPKGTIVYASDFKLDDSQEKIDYGKLEKLDAKVLIVESLRVHEDGKTPEEASVKPMLENIIAELENRGLIVFTTFSAHITRIATAIELAREIDRQIFVMGRSLVDHVICAETLGMLSRQYKLFSRRNSIKHALDDAFENRQETFLIVTGNQGEPGSVLRRIAEQNRLCSEDTVIFSCNVIPNEINIRNRQEVESMLRKQGANIIKDIHVSGHARRQDHANLLQIIDPEIVVPCHGDAMRFQAYKELCKELGYEIKILENGQSLALK